MIGAMNGFIAGGPYSALQVIPANVVNGVIRPNIPPNYASMGSYHDDTLNLNAHYFGQINPALTGER